MSEDEILARGTSRRDLLNQAAIAGAMAVPAVNSFSLLTSASPTSSDS
jgi:hypothetical protein